MDYINVYIEALTGTRFHLRVSLQDRIFAIKMWILRHEGIPASYQHLIYGDVELEDDATLESCHVPDKATLKLVVSMRGGPVRMRRIPPSGEVDMSWLEMWDLLDLNQEQIWDVAPGGKPVTVLLFRDGESVNFFRVIENSDGTYSPLSETLNGNTLRSLFAEADDESARKAIENDLLREKLNELRTKMQLKGDPSRVQAGVFETMSRSSKGKRPSESSRKPSSSPSPLFSVRRTYGTKFETTRYESDDDQHDPASQRVIPFREHLSTATSIVLTTTGLIDENDASSKENESTSKEYMDKLARVFGVLVIAIGASPPNPTVGKDDESELDSDGCDGEGSRPRHGLRETSEGVQVMEDQQPSEATLKHFRDVGVSFEEVSPLVPIKGRTSTKLARAASIVAFAKEMASAAAVGASELPGRRHRRSRGFVGADRERKRDRNRDWVLSRIHIMVLARGVLCVASAIGASLLAFNDVGNTTLWLSHMCLLSVHQPETVNFIFPHSAEKDFARRFGSYVVLFTGISYARKAPLFILFLTFLFTGLTNMEEGEMLLDTLQNLDGSARAVSENQPTVAGQEGYYDYDSGTAPMLRVWGEDAPKAPEPRGARTRRGRGNLREGLFVGEPPFIFHRMISTAIAFPKFQRKLTDFITTFDAFIMPKKPEKEKRERKRRRRSVVVKPGSAGRSGSSRTGSSSHLRTPRGTPEKLQTVHGSRSSKASIRTSTGTGLKLPPINATTTTTTTGTRNKYRVMPKVDTGLRGSSNNKTQKKVIGLETETLLMAAAAASSAVRKTSVVKQETVQQVTETGARVFGSDAQRPRTTPNLDFGKAFEREIVTISPALSTVSELGTKLHNEAKGTEIMNILNSKRSKFNRAMEAQRKGALLRDEVKPKPQKILEIDLDTPDDRVLEALRRLSIGEERVKSPEGKVRRPRCSVCRKKLNLTNGFDCRCGNLFCGLHRYAEAHDCSFDYKTEGRRQISESNPLVIAQKLPKI
ncbi:unnamed protein product [Notodromas monacha]|uniref:AN1-type zinc finger and ubiquitin domain-containing protein 1 n=1 Tax=Notodromas monacha TaxID=399045 RepID=A0A7R9BM99_9CRUS|nr:unnamed protein product [Notodromas monacha]CAG0918120.1 unnamed protein product [Notodromas monacha]